MDGMKSLVLVFCYPPLCFPDALKHHGFPLSSWYVPFSESQKSRSVSERERKVQKKLFHFSTEIAFKIKRKMKFLWSEFFSEIIILRSRKQVLKTVKLHEFLENCSKLCKHSPDRRKLLSGNISLLSRNRF